MHSNQVLFSLFNLYFHLPLFLQFQVLFGSWPFCFYSLITFFSQFKLFIAFVCLVVSLCCLESGLVCYRVLSCPLPRFPGLWLLIPGSSSPLSRVKSLVLWVSTWRLDWCDFWDPLQATGSRSSYLALPLELMCSSPLPSRTGSVVIPPAPCRIVCLAPLFRPLVSNSIPGGPQLCRV